MVVPLRRASTGMKFLSWLLLLFFIELIMETGIELKSVLAVGLSVKNLFLLSFAAYVFFKTSGSFRWASALGLRKIILLFLLLAIYTALSLSFPTLLGSTGYDLLVAAYSYKNEMLDAFLCMLIFAYFASRPGLGGPMLQGILLIVGISALLTFIDTTLMGGKMFGFTTNTMRSKGAFGEPNQTAAVFAMFAPICGAMVLAGQRALLNLVLLGCIIVAVLVTGSRGGMVASAVALLFTLWTSRNHITVEKKVLFAIAAPCVALLLWALLPGYYKELLLERFFVDSKKDVSMRELSAGRTLIWEYAFDYWVRSPIIGNGWFNFATTAHVATHNTFVDYVVSLGVVGLSMLLYLWYTVFAKIRGFSRALYLPKPMRILATGCCGAVLGIMTAIFFVNLYKPWLFVWIGMGTILGYFSLMAALYRQQAQERNRQAGADSIGNNPADNTELPAVAPSRLGYLRAKEGL